jgi:uroporphyrinogen decarboxylase
MASEKTERTLAALRGDDVDRVPVSAWWHDFAREWSAEGLAEATLEAYRAYGWDFVKVNPRATYYAEDWGARYVPAGGPRQPVLEAPAVAAPEHLERIETLHPQRGAYGEQLEALHLIARGLAGEAPFIQTVFSPLAVVSRLTGSTAYTQRLMREHPAKLAPALENIADTLARYAQACLEAGASGIFFATVEWGSSDNISAEEYEAFGRPYDLRVLEAAAAAPFNVLHVCRERNHLLRLLDYPVRAFHWDVHGEGNPAFGDVLAGTGAAVMGGVRHGEALRDASPADVSNQAQRAVAETRGRRFLLAPGCSIEPDTPETNLRALVQSARVNRRP